MEGGISDGAPIRVGSGLRAAARWDGGPGRIGRRRGEEGTGGHNRSSLTHVRPAVLHHLPWIPAFSLASRHACRPSARGLVDRAQVAIEVPLDGQAGIPGREHGGVGSRQPPAGLRRRNDEVDAGLRGLPRQVRAPRLEPEHDQGVVGLEANRRAAGCGFCLVGAVGVALQAGLGSSSATARHGGFADTPILGYSPLARYKSRPTLWAGTEASKEGDPDKRGPWPYLGSIKEVREVPYFTCPGCRPATTAPPAGRTPPNARATRAAGTARVSSRSCRLHFPSKTAGAPAGADVEQDGPPRASRSISLEAERAVLEQRAWRAVARPARATRARFDRSSAGSRRPAPQDGPGHQDRPAPAPARVPARCSPASAAVRVGHRVPGLLGVRRGRDRLFLLAVGG